MLKRIKNVNIKAIATCVPEKQVDIFDNKKIYNGNIKKLKKVVKGTGFHKRHILDENSNITAGDLAYYAAEKLIESAKINKDEFDAVLMVTQYPDYFGPATACVIHGKLGLSDSCIAFDINQGCTGYIYGLFVAANLITSKTCKKVLLLVADTPTKSHGAQLEVTNEIPIFGDGGSATILEWDDSAAPIFFDIGTQGINYDVIIGKNGAFRNPPSMEMFVNGKMNYGHEMDGLKVFDFTMNTVPKSIFNILKFAHLTDKEINYYLFHQANRMILENIAVSANINVDKILRETLSKYGNLSCASIPSIINDEFLLFNRKNINVLMCGFGIGLSWGSAIANLKNAICLPVIIYKKGE